MGHIALYREWRPKTFDEIVEQSHTVAALRQAVLSGKIAHAYLFSGTRGTGKTTMAQVFSRAINCLTPVNGNPCNQCPVCTGILNGSVLDVIEMDAASNNSVDTIRRLCDEIVFTPSVTRFKVYIIDEVHMLSTGAFNALLKTLEEPPAHAVFILATTEQHRIPATILSRCQRYEFRRIPIASITERLRKIADADGVKIREDALKAIAQLADGALRDAISLLDQAKGSFQGTIGKEDILSLVGVVNDDFMHQMALAIVRRDPAHAMRLVEEFILDGRDVIRFTMDLAAYFRNVMICNVTRKPEDLVYAPAKTIDGMKEIAAILPLEALMTLIRQLSELVSDLRWSLSTRITFEVAVIRIMDLLPLQGGVAQRSPIAVKTASVNDSIPLADTAAPETVGTAAAACVPAALETTPSVAPGTIDPTKPESLPEAIDPATTVISPEAFDTASLAALATAGMSPMTVPEAETKTALLSSLFTEEESSDFAGLSSEASDFTGEKDTPSTDSPVCLETSSPVDLAASWPRILDYIISVGQMTVYLFLLPAKPVMEQDTLRILFEDKDRLNYSELSTKPNHQVISQAVFQSTGIPIPVVLGLRSQEMVRSCEKPVHGDEQPGRKTAPPRVEDSAGTKASAMELLKKSAEELGISFYNEQDISTPE